MEPFPRLLRVTVEAEPNTMTRIFSLFRYRKGDDAFETLVAPHVERLYRLAYRFTGDRNDAEDLVQELLTHLYPRRAALAQVRDLGPWLARALYHRFVDTWRHRAADPLRGAADEEVLAALADPRADVQRDTLLQARLNAALAHLNADQRAVIALHDIEGYTLDELETLLETPLGTLKSRLHRARRELRTLLGMEPFDAQIRVDKQRSRL